MTQQPLFKLPVAEPKEPSEKQAVALAYVQAAGARGLDGVSLGQLVHGHADGEPCRFCKSAGLGLLRALKKKGHVRQAKGGIFIALDLPDEPLGGLPEGF